MTEQSKPTAFGEAMHECGLRQVDLAKLTGVDRTTVWRWSTGRTEAPEYAWTIVRQQKRIRSLAEKLASS